MAANDIKARMVKARQLIQQQDYDAARAILETIEHPKAQEWLSKLPPPAKPKKKSPGQAQWPLIGAGVVLAVIVAFGLGVVVGREMLRSEIANALSGLSGDDVTSGPTDRQLTATAIVGQNATTEATLTLVPVTPTEDVNTSLESTQVAMVSAATRAAPYSDLEGGVSLSGCDHAQTWFDITMGIFGRAVEQVDDYQGIDEFEQAFQQMRSQVAALDYPDCVANARTYMLDYFDQTLLGVSAARDGDEDRARLYLDESDEALDRLGQEVETFQLSGNVDFSAVFGLSEPDVDPAPTDRPQSTDAPISNAATISCPSLSATCGELTCEQAYACLRAGKTSLDRDKDGVPCESVCPGG